MSIHSFFIAIGIRSLCITIILLSFNGLKAQTQFSKNQVLEDIAFLKTLLEKAHYDVYAYTTKQEFDRNYEAIRKSIQKDSMSLLEVTSIFQKVISKVNNGHTEISFPGESYGEYLYGGGTAFPLEIAFEYGKPLIRKNWSTNDSIKIGSEVISINGVKMTDILSKIYPLISAERPYFKNVKLELFSFPRYYWQVFGQQAKFEVNIRTNNTTQSHTVDAINLLEDYEQKRTEVLNAKMSLRFIKHSAYLNPGNLSGDLQKYRQFIDSAFVKIKESKSKNLIIDFRNNSGGDEPFSNYLVSYFAHKSFKWSANFTLKTSKFLKEQVRLHSDTTKKYSQEILTHKNGEIYPYKFKKYHPQPKEKRFEGKVYVLVNRQSHSQSAVAAAQIQDYKFGTIVGEETGEYPSLYASIFHYPLPNTGVSVQISKGYITRVNGSTKQEGVIPDIFIKDHLLDEKDEILEGLLKKINP